MPTSAAQQSDAENVRLVIAKQTTIAGSIQALLRAVCSVCGNALAKGDPGAIQAFIDHIDADPKSWSDAVMANTPQAQETVYPVENVPLEVQDAFRTHAAHVQAQYRDEAQKGEQPKSDDKHAQHGQQGQHQDKR